MNRVSWTKTLKSIPYIVQFSTFVFASCKVKDTSSLIGDKARKSYKKREMCSLLNTISPAIWTSVYSQYDAALCLKANKMKPDKKKDLLVLDKWFQTELPDLIESRSPKHVTHEELCKLMKWKLTRGKFRPRLTEMVASNSDDEVLAASTKAFKALPNVSAAIQALSVLKAVGPATASAVLAAGSPQNVAFMADECLLAFPGLQPIKYDLPFYMAYMDKVKPICKQLNKDDPDASWTPHKVELTLWTYQMIHTLDPVLSASLMQESHADQEPTRKKQRK